MEAGHKNVSRTQPAVMTAHSGRAFTGYPGVLEQRKYNNITANLVPSPNYFLFKHTHVVSLQAERLIMCHLKGEDGAIMLGIWLRNARGGEELFI